MSDSIVEYIEQYRKALNNKTFVKLTVSKPLNKQNSLKKFSFRLVEIRGQQKIQCVDTNRTNDITINYNFEESIERLKSELGISFKTSVLYTTEKDITLLFNKKMEGRLLAAKASVKTPISTKHNREKKRFIKTENNPYLLSLGVVDSKGKIHKNSVDKFKQINKYIETVDNIIKASELKNQKQLNIVDMGSGKGYLTFALYDYLKTSLHKNITMVGVEQRPNLVKLCNTIVKENNFKGLSFSEGSIDSFTSEKIDILIALHACDTATDDAIYNGISSKASVIITAPCCHKQVRKQLNIDNELQEITQYGILEERQSEILTDTIRALVLESEGYKSQVFEFIADAHTHKNVMVVGIKKKVSSDKKKYLKKIDQLKKTFGLEYQHLEKKIRST